MGNLALHLVEGCSFDVGHALKDVSYSLEFGVRWIRWGFQELFDCLFVDPPLFVLLVPVRVCKCVSSWLCGAVGD